jgi:heat shock protein HslJ/uncharacterized membrane protein
MYHLPITCLLALATQLALLGINERPFQSDDPYIRLHKNGYEFYATGNEPFWNLAIDFDKEMVLSRMGEDDIKTLTGEETRAMDANVIQFASKTDSVHLVVEITEGLCQDTMADEQRPFKVKVKYKLFESDEFTEVTGCGNYLADPRLHNIWAMTSLNGNGLSPDDFPNGVPRLELFTREGRVLGFDGCNTFRGSFYVKDARIHFGLMASTMMACEGIMDVGAAIGKTLHNRRMEYQFKENELILFHDEGEIHLRPID